MGAVTPTNSPPPVPERSLWSSLWEAIRGSPQDYTTGNLNRAIFLLAVPMVLEMVLESLFAVVDVFWVAHLGADGGYRRAYRIHVEPGVCCCDGIKPVHHGDGRAAHRREGSGRCRGCRSAGDHSRAGSFFGHRN